MLIIECSFIEFTNLSQARIQRLKEVNQTDVIPVFPLADVCISKYTSVITCITLPTLVRWLGAHQFKISWKLHPNTSNTDLQARPILKYQKQPFRYVIQNRCSKNLAKFKEKRLCWSLVSNRPATLWKSDSGTVVFLCILRNV